MAGAVTAAVQPIAKDSPPAAGTDHTFILALENIHCGACVRTVEETLSAAPGVSAARVNLSQKRAVVTVQGGVSTAESLVETLRDAGFPAAELSSDRLDEQDTGSVDLLRRLAVAAFAAMNIMLLSVSVWSDTSTEMGESLKSLFHWISALIALPTVAYAGQPFFRSAWNALSAGRLNMDVPISLGVILTTAMSLYRTVDATGSVYFDAAVMLLAFLLVGRYLDEQMRTRAKGAAANLLGLKSSAASVITSSGAVERRAVKDIAPGTLVMVAAGERIAVDGTIERGNGVIDQSLITGEALPKPVKAGDDVFAGTINLEQPIVIRSTRLAGTSLLADIAELMSTAEQARGRYVRLADRAARLYAPAVHVLGLLTFIGWLVAGNRWEASLTNAITVLIITCPCALALAVPAVQVAASSRLFSSGIILKAADGLERLNEVDTVVFDKTGTLTYGEPRLVNGDEIEPVVLGAAASLAAASRHPYSRAIVSAAREAGLKYEVAHEVGESRGAGLARATAEGEERLGSAAFCGIDAPPSATPVVWYKGANGAPIALRFADVVRADSSAVVARLKSAGYGVELLSGDESAAVASAAETAGIETWRARQKPDQKIMHLEALKKAGRRVLMVGDGLNDAPALAAAHASLSPSGAADISQTAADAIFQGARLEPVITALAVSKAAHRLAMQNFALSIIYNIIFVPLAIAGALTPLIAAVAMSASSITVTANAMRMRGLRLEMV